MTFFRNTHPAEHLKKVIQTVFCRLADPNEPGATLRLSTGLGGGKTHALTALWHLARNIGLVSLGSELLPGAGRPRTVTVAGINARGFGTSMCGTHDGLQTHSLWGELAHQFGGSEGYRRLKALDDPQEVPDAGTVRAMLPEGPVLILMDELVIYMAHLSDRAQNGILAFINTLTAEIGARRQAVPVISDPGSQPAYERQAKELREAIEHAGRVLKDVLGRKVSDYDPTARRRPRWSPGASSSTSTAWLRRSSPPSTTAPTGTFTPRTPDRCRRTPPPRTMLSRLSAAIPSIHGCC